MIFSTVPCGLGHYSCLCLLSASDLLIGILQEPEKEDDEDRSESESESSSSDSSDEGTKRVRGSYGKVNCFEVLKVFIVIFT